ncbi:uncharacterized protein FTOL_08295 [Fusarium torulosum]|uniref:Uncharacterized protein n=1 Tax=Fusarium torulosum TaxID=33205 RepID=A0AAE8MCC5_9HYPO|nr:uncharacterized protein FTOL_08295 [Fusarium torulosum]
MGNHEAGVYFNHRVTIGDQRHGAPTLPDLTTSKLDDDDSTSIAFELSARHKKRVAQSCASKSRPKFCKKHQDGKVMVKYKAVGMAKKNMSKRTESGGKAVVGKVNTEG